MDYGYTITELTPIFMVYKNKYLKYKNTYLSLKNIKFPAK